MTLRQAWITSGIIILGMLAMTGIAWPLFPPGQMIPVHFTFDGTPNKFAPREFGLLILPAFALLAALLMSRVAVRNNFAGFVPLADRPAAALWIVILAVLAGGQALIIGYALHPEVEILRLFFGAIGILIAVLGAAMSRVEPNAAFGIRNPWTRTDRGVWQRTHVFGSAVFVVAGVFLAGVAAFWPHPASLALVLLADIAIAAVLCTLYSYLIFRSRSTGEGTAFPGGAVSRDK
ncbi:MAG TPA: SdpI family protein [Stellaceae bacterium]|jgi:uncharacterized membrane protein|nr:SdpI family protein [Stellaceae bacterium]